MTPQTVTYKDLGVTDYGKCLQMQEALFDRLVEAKGDGGRGGQCLILVEHPHVYTLGRSGQENNLLVGSEFLAKIGATYYRTGRGGDITYHGPGQLVGYPILDLEALGLGLKEYIHALEDAVIRTLADYGIAAGRSQGATGVWLEAPARKICAIGVRTSRWVTMHGFALNVNTQLDYFNWINPCGFTDRGVTSMERELGAPQDMEQIKKVFRARFEEVMNVKIKIENHAESKEMGAETPG